MKQSFWISCTLFLFVLHTCVAKRYDNYTLFRGIPITTRHLEFFREIEYKFHVNFWRDPSVLNKTIEFTIPPEEKKEFITLATKEDVYITTIIEDIQRAFDKQSVKSYIRRRMETFDWEHYFRINDINGWLDDLCKNYAYEVSCLSIGKSHEDRIIKAVRVYLKSGPEDRPTVIVEGGIHAREWISPAFVTYFLNEIVNSPSSDNDKLKLIGVSYEWLFIPVLNPDGYEYSHEWDRLWRKNRRGAGVDLNRNFGYNFGTVGVSHEPSSEVFCGEKEFSEPETAAMKAFIDEHSEHLDYYLSFHSYGQYVIIPYAHTKTYLENFNEVKEIGREAAKEIFNLYGTKYTVGTAYDTVGYLVAGSSICWTKATYHVPYVMTFELRDQGTFGFALPADQIIKTNQEMMKGMMSLLQSKNTNYQYKKENFEHLNDFFVKDAQENKFLDTVVILCKLISGGSMCWAKATHRVPYAVTFELRDDGPYGFALPTDLILPTCQETMRGMIVILAPKGHPDKRWKYGPSPTELMENGQEKKFIDFFLIVCNVLLFIIARFE